MRETNVPTGWSVRTLGDLGHIKVGLTYKPENVSEFGTLVLRSSNIQNDRLAFQDNVFVDMPVGEGATVNSGDLLICVRNGSRRLIGKTAMIDQVAHGMAFGAFMSAFRSDLNPYLVWLFQSKIIQEQIEENLGATINQITNATLKRLQIPLPDDPKEQQAVAEALADADALIEELERLIAKKRLIKQGAMQDLLTAKRRLPGFSGDWVRRTLPELAEIRSGGTPNTSNPEMWNGDIAWCTPTDITALNGSRFLDRTARHITDLGLRKSAAELLPAGTIVMTSRATIGECAIASMPISTNQGFKNFIARTNVDRDFLFYLLNSQKAGFIELCSGSTFLEIGMSQLRKYLVQLPEDVNEQCAISSVLNDLNAEIEALETRLDKARQVKEGMMQNLLTGRIRLV